MRAVSLLHGALMAFVLVGSAAGAEPTVETARPVVVKTEPAPGATGVDPALSAIKVTFNKDMKAASWSWAMESAASFPPAGGDPRFEADKRTAILPVKLAPGRTYVIWVNSDKAANFKDTGDRPAVPYLLVFETKR